MTRPDLDELERTADRLESTATSWDELKTSGKSIVEAASTTYSRNSRYGLFENGTWVTPDRFDELVTEVPPLYETTVPAGETYTVTGKDRNPYLPGSDYTSATTSQFPDTGAAGDYLPAGITVTQGLVDLENGDDEGIAFVFEQDDLQFGTFQDGTLSNIRSLAGGEWLADPFSDEEFAFDLSKFAVKREEGNLYGAGSQNAYFKLRDTEGSEEYLRMAETGDPTDPIVDTFSLYNQIRVENTSGSPFTFRFGPLQYFNESSESVPTRTKRGLQRNITITTDYTASVGDVIAVYRKDPNNVEPPVEMRISAAAETTGTIDLREVHPDYVDFGTIDETDDANWAAPAGLRQRETAIQSLDMTVGDVSLNTDSEGPRGEQLTAIDYDGVADQGPNPAQTDERTATNSAIVNENDYFVATARHEDTATDIARFRPITIEGW